MNNDESRISDKNKLSVNKQSKNIKKYYIPLWYNLKVKKNCLSTLKNVEDLCVF